MHSHAWLLELTSWPTPDRNLCVGSQPPDKLASNKAKPTQPGGRSLSLEKYGTTVMQKERAQCIELLPKDVIFATESSYWPMPQHQ